MGLWHWIFGKHPVRPPDPERTATAATLPRWQAEQVMEELAAAGIHAVLSDTHTSFMGGGSTEMMTRVYAAETDVHRVRAIIDEFVRTADSEFLLRPASSDDVPFLREMLHAAIFAPPGVDRPPFDIVDEPGLARYVERFGELDGDVGWVAESFDGAPLGAAWVRRFSTDAPGYGFVDAATPELSIAVVDGYRGRGIGSGLLVALLDGLERVSLSVDVANPAVALYERLGFTVVDGVEGGSIVMLRVDDRPGG